MVKKTIKSLLNSFLKIVPIVNARLIHLNKFTYFYIPSLSKKILIPNVIVIGAQKSGTTTLHRLLQQIPEIYCSWPIKESGFFLDNDIYIKNKFLKSKNITNRTHILKRGILPHYNGQEYVVDFSTYYTIGENSKKQGVIENISKISPNAKLIYILRDPLERIKSHYFHVIRNGYYSKSIEEFVTTDEYKFGPVSTSSYYDQIEPYLKKFRSEQILLLDMGELISEPKLVVSKICKFIKLEKDILPEIKEVKANSSSNKGQIPKELLEYKTDTLHSLKKGFNNQKLKLEKTFNFKPNWNFK